MSTLPTLRVKYVLTTHYGKLAVTAPIFIGICTALLLTNVATPALAVSPLADDSQPEQTTHLAGVSQGATVTIINSTDAFTDGQTLEDRSAFPLQNASAPVVTASGDAQNATVNTIEIRITYTASSTGDPGDTFYTNEETVATKEIGGPSGAVESVVDIRSVFATKTDLEDEFGSGVTVTPTIESIVTYQYTSVTGQTLTGTVSAGGEITAVGALYSLPSRTNRQRHETGPAVTDTTSPLVNTTIGAVGAAFLSLFAGALFIGRRGDRQALGRRIEAKRFDDWVTEIESYTPRGNLNVVHVDTIAGLVNLAIDIHERVLYTAQLEEFIVVDDNTMYKYRRDDSDVVGWSEFFGFSRTGPDPDMPDFDSGGNRISTPSPNENNPYTLAEPDSETGSDSDAEGDE